MSTVMCGAMSIVLFSAWRSFPAEIGGLREWGMGLLLMVAGTVLLALRGGTVPRPLPVLSMNAVLLWGIGLSLIGTEKFYGLRPSWRLFHGIWLVGMAAIAWWLLVWPDFPVRVAVFSTLVSVIYWRQVWLIARHGERQFPTLLFGMLMLAQALVVATRGVLALFAGGTSVDLLRPGTFQNVYLAISSFMVLMLVVGFLTVATRRLQTILELRSTRDPLTQVLNRRGFADVYARERALMQRERRAISLISIDLDHFKSINDRYGHATGDRVLVHVAEVIGKVLRASDHVARFGGEEFVVLLPDTGMERACSVAERIQDVLREPRQDGLPACTASIGVACQLSAEEDLDGILLRADGALYRAKALGRDRIEVAEPASLPPRAALG
ncbi:GGDEF domain-containing protein [Duganella sp. FT3S]|uniref:diguanylate cyclase n=1 Tax=Rugamonas fusca TaxID=2758568 RepID=A0A7W2EM88_9BURK|nr:GGDEF domain-containing protein [Rugamonas fusca]MBA5608483.1 GGDEF domain-containing protein [Rugamonas fusca]